MKYMYLLSSYYGFVALKLDSSKVYDRMN